MNVDDSELIRKSGVPAPIASAFLRGDEAGLTAFLDLLFACHSLVDHPDRDNGPWEDSDSAFFVKRGYMDATVNPALKVIAPTWHIAKQVSEQWLREWPHDCGEMEWWTLRRDELEDQSALTYLRKMMLDRCR